MNQSGHGARCRGSTHPNVLAAFYQWVDDIKTQVGKTSKIAQRSATPKTDAPTSSAASPSTASRSTTCLGGCKRNFFGAMPANGGRNVRRG